MKPDKIYIGTVTLSSNSPSEEHLLPDWHLRPNPKIANVEYLRKDALLKWAKKKQYESLIIVANNFWQEVIDKINAL